MAGSTSCDMTGQRQVVDVAVLQTAWPGDTLNSVIRGFAEGLAKR